MAALRLRLIRFAFMIFVATGALDGARAACEEQASAFEQAVAVRSMDAAIRAAGNFARSASCLSLVDTYRDRLIDFLLSDARRPELSAAERDRAVEKVQDILSVYRNWRSTVKLADFFMQMGDWKNGYRWYEHSVNHLASNPGTTSDEERKILLQKVAAALNLTNSGENDREGDYVPTSRDIDGGLGGIFSKEFLRLRGAEAVSIPIPINFYTDQTLFTPNGEKAFRELLEAVLAAQPRKIKLVGHADSRGARQHNQDLSRWRAEAVGTGLKRGGFKGQIETEGRGISEPFDISVLPYKISREEQWQLDRRVEWIRDALP